MGHIKIIRHILLKRFPKLQFLQVPDDLADVFNNGRVNFLLHHSTETLHMKWIMKENRSLHNLAMEDVV